MDVGLLLAVGNKQVRAGCCQKGSDADGCRLASRRQAGARRLLPASAHLDKLMKAMQRPCAGVE